MIDQACAQAKRCLPHHPFADETTSIIENAKRKSIRAGTTIFREHEAGDFAYLIETGKVELYAEEDGEKVVITTVGAGDLFGEMSIIDNSRRTASAVALEDTVVLPIGAEMFQEKLGNSDPMAYMFLRVIAGRYRWALRRALDNKNINASKTMMMAGMDTRYMRVRESAISRLRIEQDLQEAIDKEQFVLYYQPIVAMETGVIAGFEALLRWQHPERGMISPDEFVGIAEETGQIIPIGSWVIEKACEDLPRFQDVFDQIFMDQPRLFMSINVSPKQIDKLSKLNRLQAMLDTHGTDPSTVKLELTEDLLVASPEAAALALGRIKETGVELALDDFGTGYSSMSYLHKFPLDVLKIDRTFINAVTKDSKGLDIVQGIVGLARALRLKVVAEGVEDLETLNKIRSIGCDYLQGYFASKPWPLEAMLASLARHCRSRANAMGEQKRAS